MDDTSIEPLLLSTYIPEPVKLSYKIKLTSGFIGLLSISQIIIGIIAYYNLNNYDYLDYWLFGNGINMILLCINYLIIEIKQEKNIIYKCSMCIIIVNLLILIGGIIGGVMLYSIYANITSPTFIQGYVLLIIFFELIIGFISSRIIC
jgi:hypothetical protein